MGKTVANFKVNYVHAVKILTDMANEKVAESDATEEPVTFALNDLFSFSMIDDSLAEKVLDKYVSRKEGVIEINGKNGQKEELYAIAKEIKSEESKDTVAKYDSYS